MIDAGRGMGLTHYMVIRRIELPLAVATIFGASATSAVNVVATATIDPPCGRADARRLHPERQRLRGRTAGSRARSLSRLLALTVEFAFAGIQRWPPHGV